MNLLFLSLALPSINRQNTSRPPTRRAPRLSRVPTLPIMNTSEFREFIVAGLRKSAIKRLEKRLEIHNEKLSRVPHRCSGFGAKRREETIDLASSNGSPASTAQFTVSLCIHRE